MVPNVEDNMCCAVTRGAADLPGSKATSRRQGLRWNPGSPVSAVGWLPTDIGGKG